MVLVKQVVESLQIFIVLNSPACNSTGIGQIHSVLHLLGDALLWGTAVEGVVDAHPMDGEIAHLAELTIAEHLLAEVTHLDVERPLVQAAGYGTQHLIEQLVALILTFLVGTFAHNPAMHEEERREDGGTVSDQGQQLAQGLAGIVGTDCHIGLHPRCGRGDDK